MAKRQTVVLATDEEVGARLLEAVSRLVEPETAVQIRKRLPQSCQRDAKILDGLLTAMASSGGPHRYAKGKTVRYHAEPPDLPIGRAILADVGDRPLTWTELKKLPALKKAGKWVGTKELDRARDGLLRAGRIHKWPKLGPVKSVRFATRPASLEDPADFVGPLVDKFQIELKALARALAKGGATQVQVEQAAHRLLPWVDPLPSVTAGLEPKDSVLEQVLLEALAEADPASANGAPVSLARLRARVAHPLTEKAIFDGTVWRLGLRGLVSLQRHDFPAGCTEAERAAMVPDRQGGYYTTISRRRDR
jgi:hypothetical protein